MEEGEREGPHRRIHTVAGKRRAVSKALGDMYNLQKPHRAPGPPGQARPGQDVADRSQREERGLRYERQGEERVGVPAVSSGVPPERGFAAAPRRAPRSGGPSAYH